MKYNSNFKGLVQIYTGNGKGKTTAAAGLAARAAGRELPCAVVQFMKTGKSGEIEFFKKTGCIDVYSFGRDEFIDKKAPEKIDFELAEKALEQARRIMESETVNLLILDEINNALDFGLIDTTSVLDLLKQRPPHTELVLTGRNAPQEIIDEADLVTEMLEIKHPWKNGYAEREGIEY